MKSAIRCLVVLMLFAVAGCFGSASTERTTAKDGTAISTTTATVAFAPRDAVNRAVTVLKRLKINGGSGGIFGMGGSDWPVKADYYSATTSGKSAAGDKIEVSANWIAENKSEIKIRSSLTQDQHANLVDQIMAGMK